MQESVPVTEKKITTITLAQLCSRFIPSHITTIDFLSIDVEGHEQEVLKGADWTHFRPRIIVIEAVKPGKLIRNLRTDAENALWHNWEPALLAQHYIFAQFNGLNRFYVREEDKDLLDHFIIPISPHLDRYETYKGDR